MNPCAACPYEVYLEYEENASEYSDLACVTLLTPGCIDNGASNYNPFANSDDGSCEYIEGCMDETSTNYSSDAVLDDGSCIYISGCTNVSASNYNQDATTDDGSCIINGCTDIIAFNYSDIATQDDSSCIYEGCTISSANNYNPNATINDNSCIISGCMLDAFPNYNPIATQSDGTCSFDAEELTLGCTDQNTWTYNPNANFDDGSCSNELTVGAIGQGGIVFHIDTENELAYVASQLIMKFNEDSWEHEWGCYSVGVNGADGQAIGTGYQNTLDIVSQCVSENGGITAANAAISSETNGFNDWYLPSTGELQAICNNLGGGFINNVLGYYNGDYYSSTELDNWSTYEVRLNGDCGLRIETKWNTARVLPIRHFNYSSSGCTNPSAFNYQPTATEDDG